MGNTISTTPAFLQQQQQQQNQNDQNPNSNHHQQQQQTKAKPLKSKPSLKEPAFRGYVAGWRKHDLDNDDEDGDEQEFSFATFQQASHHHESSGYEGDDEIEEESYSQDRDGQGEYQDGDNTANKKFTGKNATLHREEFATLETGRGRGLERSQRERQRRKGAGDGGDGGGGGGGTWKERKWDPSMERKLARVRQTVADEHAVGAGLRPMAGVGRDGKGVGLGIT